MHSSLPGRFPVYFLPALFLTALLWLHVDPAQAHDGGPKITSGPTITASPGSGDAYRRGEAITIAVTSSEPVTVTGKTCLPARTGEDGATLRLAFADAVKGNDADGPHPFSIAGVPAHRRDSCGKCCTYPALSS